LDLTLKLWHGEVAIITRMKLSAFVLSATIAAFVPFNSYAQLGEAILDGIRIDVREIYRVGDSRDLDCIVRLEFSGEKFAGVLRMSQAGIIRAIDDTGADLVRTNKQHYAFGTSPPWQTQHGYSETIALKTPAPNAKTIRLLEGEVEIFTPTVNPPIFTNFISQSDQTFSHPLLDRFQIKLSYRGHKSNNAAGSAEKEIELQVDDPLKKLTKITFQRADGSLLRAASTSIFETNPRLTTTVYNFNAVPPRDLKMVVYLAVPEASQKIQFKLENIRLPWVDSPELLVEATDVTKINIKNKDEYACRLLLTFTGGPVAGSSGIRKLKINRAESDTGQNFKIKEDERYWLGGFSPLDNSASGRNAHKWVPLVASTNNVKSIRILEGEAELFVPNSTNGGIVEFDDFLNHPGEPLSDEALNRSKVKLTYLGPDNFETLKKDWQAHRATFIINTPLTKLSEDIKDSLQFSVDDPEKRIIQMEFLNAKGEPLIVSTQMNSTKELSTNSTSYQLFTFRTLPPAGTRLRIELATPESLKPVKFKVENIPL
jgi:hypothetical protein